MLDKATVEAKAKLELKESKETEMDKEWRQIQQNMQQNAEDQRKSGTDFNQTHQQYPLKYNDDGNLSFYWFDAHEENYGADVYLFGKVWQPEIKQFVSCSLKV